MLDIRFIRENPDVVARAIEVKAAPVVVADVLAADETVRELRTRLDEANRAKKESAKAHQEGRADAGGSRNADASALRRELAEAEAALRAFMLLTPEVPWEGAPIGPDEHSNAVITQWGEPRDPTDVRPHDEYAHARGWLDLEAGRRIMGERGYVLRGDLLLLERAIHSYAIDLLIARDFTPVGVPALARARAFEGTGMFPKGKEETYAVPEDDLYLAGTSEVAIVGMIADQIFAESELPLRYAGVSTCFRREAGSAGRDVRGLLRVHQFEKIEQFVVCKDDPAESALWHERLLRTSLDILEAFGIAYEVVECATGDMGLGKFRMNDVNAWLPSLGTYRETHSCSTLHAWQARRANIRYRDADGALRFANTLNNTAVATPRLLAVVLENWQNERGTLTIPSVLRPYLGDRTEL